MAVATAGRAATRAFMPIIRQQMLAAGDAIRHDPADGGGLAVVAEGLVMEQRILPDGRRQVMAFRFPGDTVGVAHDTDNPWQPVAVTPVVLCRADGKALDDFRRDHPAASAGLAGLEAAEAARLADHVLVLGRLTAAERVAAFLLDCLCRAGKATREGTAFTLPMTRDDIADYLGINVETVSRQLTSMKMAKLIRLPKPGSVLVLDVERLAALVPFAPETAPGGGAADPARPAAA